MQTAVPEVLRFSDEDESTQRLYGLDHEVTRPFGQQLLAARRLAERGVRFIQVFHGGGRRRRLGRPLPASAPITRRSARRSTGRSPGC